MHLCLVEADLEGGVIGAPSADVDVGVSGVAVVSDVRDDLARFNGVGFFDDEIVGVSDHHHHT